VDSKEKIILSGEQETLLIPLYAKARDNPFIQDEKAREILGSVQYDFNQLKIPQKTEVTLQIRASQIDSYTREFIAEHSNALILHLGCGLDSRCLRVHRADTRWYDLDLPKVIELRRKFFDEDGSYHMIGSSVTDLNWIEQVSADDRPFFIAAEGLLMYLPEHEVRSLILHLHEKFPGSGLVFDAFSTQTVKRVQAHPSLQKTGAEIHWGIDDPHEIELWSDGIKLKEEWYFSQSPDLDKLSWFYRSMFRLTSGIESVQRAQRLLYFTL
jgi:O-methyltransferase involved in polyketide biosynthesis